ncbi:MAG: GIY-YIG nuclease family protein [Bacteroidales bacterium]|nr:GIY-YIG nuclease family protein [Bacteroidales bacterium]
MNKYFIYIMSNTSNSTIYVGVTNNIERRVIEHRTYDSKSFTSRYNCHKLVYYEEYGSIDEAIVREKQIKSWSRARKDKMIDSMNPDRNDLLPGIATSLRSSQ